MRIVYAAEFERSFRRWKGKDARMFRQIIRQIERIAREPLIGKPLRHAMRNHRRVHVGSFVLVYEYREGELRFLDFDHHSKVYR